ncbi:carbohydrate sulfotransferase 15-like, partial [Mizuhopecten yessoensis]|uniref:carbohydrate sulfotransferase 15-like n=1 Tax=Mizuhopecten yessoensis TaxID=6573 RepID=UPI000B45EE1C
MLGPAKGQKHCLGKLVILSVILVLLFYMKFKTHVTDDVEYQQSGMHVSSGNNLYENGYSQILLEHDQLNYTGVMESDADEISNPFTELLKKKPPVFLPGFKNPCWYDDDDDDDRRPEWTEMLCNTMEGNTGRLCKLYFGRERPENTSLLRCLPYFMLIGQPKSGSTDLFKRIMQHPDVQQGISKEPQYWARSRHCS